MKINITSIIHDADTPDRQVEMAVRANLYTSRDQVAKTLRTVQVASDMFELLSDIVAASDANDGGSLLNGIETARSLITEIDATPLSKHPNKRN